MLELVVEVRSDGVYVRFRPLQRSFTRYGFDEIESVAATTYSAGEYGGWHWGIHVGPGGSRSYRISGDRGVRLDLTDGERVFVGSDTPDGFVDAIDRAMEVAVEAERRRERRPTAGSDSSDAPGRWRSPP
jgi:hypothetical protein